MILAIYLWIVDLLIVRLLLGCKRKMENDILTNSGLPIG